MFILAYRFRRTRAERPQHDTYPVQTVQLLRNPAAPLTGKWSHDAHNRLVCAWSPRADSSY